MTQVLAEVVSNENAYHEVYLLWLKAPELSVASPGQFFMVRCGGETLLRRPLSLHRKQDDRIAFFYRVPGKGLERLSPEKRSHEEFYPGKGLAWLSRQAKGERIDVLGPFGKGFALPQRPQRLLLVAGGMGVAPLVALAEDALDRGHDVTLLVGARDASGLYPQEHLPPSLKLHLATDDGSRGDQGPVSGLVSRHLGHTDALYACGPAAMYRALAPLIPPGKPCQVSLEERMACGFGVCFGCPVFTPEGPKQVCKDGPVFELAQLGQQDG